MIIFGGNWHDPLSDILLTRFHLVNCSKHVVNNILRFDGRRDDNFKTLVSGPRKNRLNGAILGKAQNKKKKK